MKYPLVGVTGLPCAGKSYASRLLTDGSVTGEPGVLLKADDIGHQVLTRPEVVAQIADRFGRETVDAADPAEIRRRIAARVFGAPAELAWLESIVHPLVRDEIDAIVARTAGQRLVVREAAVFIAKDMAEQCDLMIVVEADAAIRKIRAAARGWGEAELERRDRRLRPLFAPEQLALLGDKLVIIRNDADDHQLVERLAALKDRLAAR